MEKQSDYIKSLIEFRIQELERLAKIGKATEIALKHGFFVYDERYDFDGRITDFNHDDTVDDLLQWLDLEGGED